MLEHFKNRLTLYASIILAIAALSSWLGFKSDSLFWHSDAVAAIDPIKQDIIKIQNGQESDRRRDRLQTIQNSLRMDGYELRDVRSQLSNVERDIAAYDGQAVPSRLIAEHNRLIDSLSEILDEMEAKRAEIRALERPQL